MKRIVALWRAENKRAWKIFPKMILQATVLALAAGAVAFCAAKLLYQREAVEIPVAVVMEEENSLTEFALDYVKQTEENVTFIVCSSTEAAEGLEKGEYAAVIVLAGQLVEGILNGKNPPVLVIFHEKFSLAGGFLKELTQAGATLLSAAQAEIYAIYELAEEFDAQTQTAQFADTLNLENLSLAMGRSGLFQYKEVSATGGLSLKTYYAAAAVTAVLLFFAMPMGMFLKQDGKVQFRQYKRAGIGSMAQQLVRLLTVLGLYGAVLLTGELLVFLGEGAGILSGSGGFYEALGVAGIKGFSGSMTGFLSMWLTAGSIGAFVLLVYEAVEKKSSGVFALAFLSVLLLFLSGGMIPKAFFPAELREAFFWLPSNFWLNGIGCALAGEAAVRDVGISSMYGLVFLAAAVALRQRRVR